MKTWAVIVIFGWLTGHPVQHRAATTKTRLQCTAAGQAILKRAKTRPAGAEPVVVLCRSRFEPI